MLVNLKIQCTGAQNNSIGIHLEKFGQSDCRRRSQRELEVGLSSLPFRIIILALSKNLFYNAFLRQQLSQDLKSEPSLLVEIITRSVSTRMVGMLGSDAASLHGGGSEWSER